MNENIGENDLMKTEVRCDVCRKTFAASEAGTRCPECKIGRIRIMEKAAWIEIITSQNVIRAPNPRDFFPAFGKLYQENERSSHRQTGQTEEIIYPFGRNLAFAPPCR